MSLFSEDELSCDAFLGGRLQLWQPKRGYRAATDPVLLAACCSAKAGESVLDLGTGAGAAILSLGVRVAELQLAGLELQEAYGALAERNAAQAGLTLELHQGSILEIPPALRRDFDHVITNPPYYPKEGTNARDKGRNTALREEVSLIDWTQAAQRRLRPGGYLWMILRTDRLNDVLAGLGPKMGSIAILPFAPRHGREAGRVVVRARKGGRAALRLLAPFILHDFDEHPGDRDHHSQAAENVFRHGGSLSHLFEHP